MSDLDHFGKGWADDQATLWVLARVGTAAIAVGLVAIAAALIWGFQ